MLDGELVIPVGDSLSFGALQDRVHPAESRVRKLSAETPALLILFDCLFKDGTGPTITAPLTKRRTALEDVAGPLGRARRVRLSRSRATARRRNAGSTSRMVRWTAWSPSTWTKPYAPGTARC